MAAVVAVHVPPSGSSRRRSLILGLELHLPRAAVRLPAVTDAVNWTELKSCASTHESKLMRPPAYWPAVTMKLSLRFCAVVSTTAAAVDPVPA